MKTRFLSNVDFDVTKKLYNLPKLGEEVIWAMPERKRFFLCEVFPYGPSEKSMNEAS